MGYRSEVMIQVKDELKDAFIALCNKAELETTDGVLHEDAIKWYHTMYPDIINIMNWLKELPDEDFGFIRIGEDWDDTEFLGEPNAFGMYVGHRILQI
jgi:hypothetical protein